MSKRQLFKNSLFLALVTYIAGNFSAYPAYSMQRGFQISASQKFEQKSCLATPSCRSEIIQINDTGDKETGTGAQNFIESLANRGIDILSNEEMKAEKKKEAFRKLLQDSFDMKTISRFSLGRYWRVSTPEQRREYQNLFEIMILDVYTQRFSGYEGQKFETRSFRSDGPKDTIVVSFLVPKEGPEIQVEWRIRYKRGRYKVIDVIVEGVSMSVTQRSDFSSVIQRGGGDIQVLLTHLSSQ